jgi:hydroxypyruvate reductase
MKPAEALRADALAIWQAAVAAVDSERLVREHLVVDGHWLQVGDDATDPLDLDAIERIVVVGAGKAGAGMAAGVEAALGPELMAAKQLTGWINVPADCVRQLEHIELHAARPAGVNEPTEEGVAGAREILRLLGSLGPHDLCLCLISGGGSALLPAPAEGITLADKLAVTRHLSGAGANIEELNTVRKQLSSLKGGGLARACLAGQLETLIISDVLGDPLDVIASGPTVADSSMPEQALTVLERFKSREAGIPARVFDLLAAKVGKRSKPSAGARRRVANTIIGNNATAVDSAGMEAERRGYRHAMNSATRPEGPAEQIGVHLAEMALHMRGKPGPNCLITGGEPVVKLVESSRRGLGGRNQQLALAAAVRLWNEPLEGIVVLSGGTDGEDGPTDAAGALFDAQIRKQAAAHGLNPADFLARNDAYHFFEPVAGLIKTGPTHTNVCDIRVVLAAGDE